ncbi:MAG TPA: radical SAM protein [Methanotrichaceae archaeon]|nr:radical SAM protein [Methanotrichaceae archaeon]
MTNYLFGPVLSRRLGLSMGVDLLAYKTCNLDCIYCELGGTACLTCRRGRFVPPERVIKEIASTEQGYDYLTFAGSGEPTLSSDLGQIIMSAKKTIDAPVAVITNSTLLDNEKVREEVSHADVVLPSLDAATPEVFERINRPGPGIKIEDIVSGLKKFRSEFGGEIWLEVMLVKGVNDDQAQRIAEAVESISPDRIQLNTVIRPPAEPVLPLDQDEMEKMLEIFRGAEIIPDWDWQIPPRARTDLLGLLSHRPCTLEEICTLLLLGREEAIKYLKILEGDGRVEKKLHGGKHYFQAAHG